MPPLGKANERKIVRRDRGEIRLGICRLVYPPYRRIYVRRA
jgi:hypothetical protein